MAAWIVLVFAAYLRPSEAMRLTGRCLVAPVSQLSLHWGILVNDAYLGVAGKTGMTDESVMIRDPLVFPILASLKRTHGDHQCLWNFTLAALQREFRAICEHLQLGALVTHLYCLRHGGASHDLLRQLLPLEEVHREGQWLSVNILTRYAKESRLLLEATKLIPQLIKCETWTEQHLVCVLNGKTVPDTPCERFMAPPSMQQVRVLKRPASRGSMIQYPNYVS